MGMVLSDQEQERQNQQEFLPDHKGHMLEGRFRHYRVELRIPDILLAELRVVLVQTPKFELLRLVDADLSFSLGAFR